MKRKTWREKLEAIRKRCEEKGEATVLDVLEVVDPNMHPNFCVQLLSLIARIYPKEFYYEDQKLIKRKRFTSHRGAISVVSYDKQRRVRPR